MKTKFIISLILSSAFCFSSAFAVVIKVPIDRPTIQAGIDAASDGDTVLVADGIYTGEDNKNINFNGKAITVQSATGSKTCIIDCEGSGRGFIFNSSEKDDSILSGFTIKNGDFYGYGGGIYIESSPTITNCVIVDNSALWGGGILISGNELGVVPNVSPTIINCIISRNEAEFDGGGIYCAGNPTITNCTITDNYAFESGQNFYLYTSHSSPTITNCIIWSGIPIGGGIGSCEPCNPVIRYSDVKTSHIGEGNIYVDPLFESDLRLGKGSACIDTGTSQSAPNYDIEGNPRPQGNGYDMGAYEFMSPKADFTANPTFGEVPMTVMFTDKSTDGAINWLWDFGDSYTNTQQNPTHTYTHAGTYTVSLSVTFAEESDSEIKTNYIRVIKSKAMPWIPLLLLDE